MKELEKKTVDKIFDEMSEKKDLTHHFGVLLSLLKESKEDAELLDYVLKMKRARHGHISCECFECPLVERGECVLESKMAELEGFVSSWGVKPWRISINILSYYIRSSDLLYCENVILFGQAVLYAWSILDNQI